MEKKHLLLVACIISLGLFQIAFVLTRTKSEPKLLQNDNIGLSVIESEVPYTGYGFCPQCKAPGKFRERRINGNDECVNGHTYPSLSALDKPEDKPKEPELLQKTSFTGKWVTNKGKNLDGTMTCDVTNVSKDNWSGKFFGTWNGVEFSYDVTWTGPMDNLKGTANIDGANYQWTGKITQGNFSNPKLFVGTFTSDRYDGNFELLQH